MKPIGGEDSLFRRMNSLFGLKISLFRTLREFVYNTLELLRELTFGTTQMAANSQNSLLFSLLSGNSRIDPGIRRSLERYRTSR
jgi:hypothetical protein